MEQSNSKVSRYKVRNCIRPDTFRYLGFQRDKFDKILETLQMWHGETKQFGKIDLWEIDSQYFLLRILKEGPSITIIKKSQCNDQEINRIHQLFDFQEV